jgi:hypothetical protein
MADWLAGFDALRVVIVDNNSDYPPLLEYYETTPHEVLRLDFNYGSAAPFHPGAGVQEKCGVTGRFIVTDPDLGIDHIPRDWLSVLNEGLDRHDYACKAGFSLRIDDLPNTDIARQAKEVEADYWRRPLSGGKFYDAYIDTSFCLLRRNYHDFPSVRSAPPYTARHLPWYYTSLADIPEDEMYYLRSTKSRGSTYWTDRILESLGK